MRVTLSNCSQTDVTVCQWGSEREPAAHLQHEGGAHLPEVTQLPHCGPLPGGDPCSGTGCGRPHPLNGRLPHFLNRNQAFRFCDVVAGICSRDSPFCAVSSAFLPPQ